MRRLLEHVAGADVVEVLGLRAAIEQAAERDVQARTAGAAREAERGVVLPGRYTGVPM